MDWIHQAVEK